MKILMVCLGNICRSPMAHGILEKKIQEKGLDWFVDSAGTSGWHDGEGPDTRAVAACARKRVDISHQISRKITPSDLETFDVILAMDASNYQDVLKICQRPKHKEKVNLFLNYRYPNMNMTVPDPYYDGKFDEVFELLDSSMEALVNHFEKTEKL
ncbi:MAG: low molecular weight phosphotyrosine protein phosphatase [Saprospiraceae bacterium]|jgi:protein-tyrosine phosphatase|nr:low molecular weight phosphotyrosine protein phosphatase [Saprospiraceae bacterium]